MLEHCAHGNTAVMACCRYDIVKHFQLDELKLVRYLMRIEEGYPTNPYHNRNHAADVLQSLHVLVARGGLREKEYCDDVSLLACYLSAVSLHRW